MEFTSRLHHRRVPGAVIKAQTEARARTAERIGRNSNSLLCAARALFSASLYVYLRLPAAAALARAVNGPRRRISQRADAPACDFRAALHKGVPRYVHALVDKTSCWRPAFSRRPRLSARVSDGPARRNLAFHALPNRITRALTCCYSWLKYIP